jgi:cytochrome c oxidase subunit 1
LDKVATHGPGALGHAHDTHDHAHHELAFWEKYIFSQDHKVIGIQYAITGMLFLLFGFTLMMIMRWQLAYPGRPIPLIGGLLSAAQAPGGIMLPEFYNQLGAMHGTIMVFLGVVPLAVGGFGNFVMPLQISAPDMAFPKLNMVSYWVYSSSAASDAFEASSDRRRAVSWTSSAALGHLDRQRPDDVAVRHGLPDHVVAPRLGQLHRDDRAVARQGADLDAPAVLRVGAAGDIVPAAARVPPLEAAGVLQLMDRLAGTSFFLPSGLCRRCKPLEVVGGGNPLLWQHLFWFLAHPEV